MSTHCQLCYNERRCRGVAQLAARTAGGREVASSSLVTPTIESTLKPTSWKPHDVGFCLFLLGFGAGRPSSGRPCKPGSSGAETTMSLGWLDVTSSSREASRPLSAVALFTIARHKVFADQCRVAGSCCLSRRYHRIVYGVIGRAK